MISFLLLLITICSFLFYGMVGEDKTWLLAPAFVFNYALVAAVLLKRAWRMAHGDERLSANSQQPIAGALFLLFVLWGIAMIPDATVPFESKLTMLFVGGVVGAYLVWGVELTTFKDNRLLVGGLIFVVMLAALYGLIIHFKCPEQVLWTERYAVYEGRLMSTYICPNHFAHLMQMLMPFCIALLFIPQTGIFLRLLCAYSFVVFLPPLFLTESRAGWLGAIAAVGVTVCLMALRRSKKLFLLLVLLVPLCSTLLLFGAWRYSETFQRRALPVVQFLQGQAEGGIGSESKDFRPQTWMDTIDMIKEAPLVGFGPGNYRYTYPEHRKRFTGTRIVTGHPHNEYLELIADYGLIGFGLFALAWCYGLVRILIASLKAEEMRHAFMGFAFLGADAGTMVHSFFDFEMHVYPNAMVFAFLAAVAVGPLFAIRHNASGTRQGGVSRGDDDPAAISCESIAEASASNFRLQTAHSRRIGAWLIAICYLLFAVFCAQIMLSAYIRVLGDRAAEAPHPASRPVPAAKQKYMLAAKIDTQNWRAYKGMADLLFAERYYSLDMDEKVRFAEQEQEWYQKACEHNPKDPEATIALGKCLIFLGRTATSQQLLAISSEKGRQSSANKPESNQTPNSSLQTSSHLQFRGLELLREASRYRPFNDVYWWTLGVELRKLGEYEEALEVFRKAQSIHRTPSTAANIKWIEKHMKRHVSDTGPRLSGSNEDKPQTPDRKPQTIPDWTLPDADTAQPDPDLLNLFEKMGE